MFAEQEEVEHIGEGISDVSLLNLLDDHSTRVIRQLNLHGNTLSSLMGLPRLQWMTELNLSSNNFTSCDLPELSFLPSLSFLDLSANSIRDISNLPFMAGLKKLSIAYNWLESVECIDENAPNLVSLDIRGNKISDANELFSMTMLRKLQDLQIGGGRRPNPVCCSIKAICGIFEDCRALRTIDNKSSSEWRDHTVLTVLPVTLTVPVSTPATAPATSTIIANRNEVEVEVDEVVSMPHFEKVSRIFRSRLSPTSSPSPAPVKVKAANTFTGEDRGDIDANLLDRQRSMNKNKNIGATTNNADTEGDDEEASDVVVEVVEVDDGTDLEESMEDGIQGEQYIMEDCIQAGLTVQEVTSRSQPLHASKSTHQGNVGTTAYVADQCTTVIAANLVTVTVTAGKGNPPESQSTVTIPPADTSSSSTPPFHAHETHPYHHSRLDEDEKGGGDDDKDYGDDDKECGDDGKDNDGGSETTNVSTEDEDKVMSSRSFSKEEEQKHMGNESFQSLKASAATAAATAVETVEAAAAGSVTGRLDSAGTKDTLPVVDHHRTEKKKSPLLAVRLLAAVTTMTAINAKAKKRFEHEQLGHYFYRMHSMVADKKTVVAVGTMVDEKAAALEERCEELEMIVKDLRGQVVSVKESDALHEKRLLQERQKTSNNSRKAFHLQATMMTLRKELQLTKESERELTAKLTAAEETRKETSLLLENEREVVKQKDTAVQELVVEVGDLKLKLLELETANTTLQSNLNESVLKSQSATTELQKLLIILEEMQAAESDLKSTLATTEEVRTQLQRANTDLTTQLYTEREKVAELEQERSESHLKAEKAARRMMASHNAFEKCSADNIALRERVQQLQEAKDERDDSIEELSECIQQLRTALKHVKSSFDREKDVSRRKEQEIQRLLVNNQHVVRSTRGGAASNRGSVSAATNATEVTHAQTHAQEERRQVDALAGDIRNIDTPDNNDIVIAAQPGGRRHIGDDGNMSSMGSLARKLSGAMKKFDGFSDDLSDDLHDDDAPDDNDADDSNSGNSNNTRGTTCRQGEAHHQIDREGEGEEAEGKRKKAKNPKSFFSSPINEDNGHTHSNSSSSDNHHNTATTTTATSIPNATTTATAADLRASLETDKEEEMEIRRQTLAGELIDAASKKITALEAKEKDYEVALKVKDAMLEDKVVVINELREKLQVAENECSELQKLVAQAEGMLEHAREDMMDLEQQLENKHKDEVALKSVIRRLKSSSSRARGQSRRRRRIPQNEEEEDEEVGDDDSFYGGGASDDDDDGDEDDNDLEEEEEEEEEEEDEEEEQYGDSNHDNHVALGDEEDEEDEDDDEEEDQHSASSSSRNATTTVRNTDYAHSYHRYNHVDSNHDDEDDYSPPRATVGVADVAVISSSAAAFAAASSESIFGGDNDYDDHFIGATEDNDTNSNDHDHAEEEETNNAHNTSDDIGEIALLLKDSEFNKNSNSSGSNMHDHHHTNNGEDNDNSPQQSTLPLSPTSSSSPTRSPISRPPRSPMVHVTVTGTKPDPLVFDDNFSSSPNIRPLARGSGPRSDSDDLQRQREPLDRNSSKSRIKRPPDAPKRESKGGKSSSPSSATTATTAITTTAAAVAAATAALEQAITNLQSELTAVRDKCDAERLEKESHQKLLSDKDKECVRIAQTLVLLEGKIEQLTSRLDLEQERNDMLTDSSRVERKRLQKTVKQLQTDLHQKEEELRRTKTAVEQLRMLVASGALNI